MQDQVGRVSAILHEASEAHHTVYRIVDGNDADWASWYADWLITLSELPEILGLRPVRSALVYQLVRLEKEYAKVEHDDIWETFYAKRLLAAFAAGGAADRRSDPS